MADSSSDSDQFPLWKFHRNYPLYTDDILNFMSQIRPTAAELMAANSAAEPTLPQQPSSTPVEVADVNYSSPTVDQPSGDYYPEPLPDNIQNSNHGDGNRNRIGDGYSRELSIAPETDTFQPVTCSCCLVLREILHTNGWNLRKLEIHGRFGILCHAISLDNDAKGSTQYKMFDFSKKSTDEVKQFVMQYYLNQMFDEYTALPEPLSDFYDVLCIGLDWDDDSSILSPDNYPPQSSTLHPVAEGEEEENVEADEDDDGEEEEEDQMQMDQQADQPPESGDQRRFPQTALARQRQRAGRMTVNDLKDYLHLPISEAAKKMNLCLTVVKKICRRSGLRRWPYRKVKSYQRKMAALGSRLRARDEETRARAEAEMDRLRQEMARFCAGVVPE